MSSPSPSIVSSSKQAGLTTRGALGAFRDDCRLCHGRNLHVFLDFGMHPHSDGFVQEELPVDEEHFFPLATALCTDCGQVQITYVVKPEYLYGNDYLYDSSVTATGRTHFLGMAKSIVERFGIAKGKLAVDIGSNVGLLLSGFRDQGLNVLGVDPAPKPTAIARANGIETVPHFFSRAVAQTIRKDYGEVAVLTGTNVCAHIDDMDDLFEGADAILEQDGIFVIEAPYFADLVQHFEYDTIYHQHLSYFSIKPMAKFVRRFGMELFDVERTKIHGGSIRMFIGRHGRHPIADVIAQMIHDENEQRLHDPTRMDAFARDVEKHRTSLVRLLMTLKDQGKTIVGLSAPAKGSTLLNYCGIHGGMLDFVTEKNQMKIGLCTPGTRIPIVGDDMLLSMKPDYALILAWNFAPEIMKNMQAYKDAGGKFIVPIPSPMIV